MSARSLQRNNIIAGAFLTVGLALFVAISFVISGGLDRLGSFADYTVRFAISDGAAGLKPGSEVTLGGYPVGRVTDVRAAADESGAFRFIDVDVAVRRRVDLYQNATVRLVQPLLGSLSSINIASIGGPGEGTPDPQRLAEGDVIRGGVSPGLLAQAGIDSDQIGVILDDVGAAVRSTRNIADALEPAATGGAPDLRASLAAFRSFTERLDDRFEYYDTRVSAVVDSASRSVPPILDAADAAVADLRAAVASVRDVLDENRADIRLTVRHVESIAARVRYDTVPRVETLLDRTFEAVDTFGGLGERADLLLASEEPAVRRTLANLRLASDQAALLLEEARAAPWRLFFQPGKKEIREEVLYGAARAYAGAVEDLRAASASLDAATATLREDTGRAAVDPEQLATMTVRVRRAFEAYERAEAELLRLLAGDDAEQLRRRLEAAPPAGE